MLLPGLRVPGGEAPSPRDFLSPSELSTQFELLLASGGGASLNRRIRGGATGAWPEDTEIWFSSTTASCAGRHARAAAFDALTAMGGGGLEPSTLTRWFNALRARVAEVIGAPDATVFLAHSPEEARGLARFAATALFGRRPVEIIATDESNSRTPTEGEFVRLIGLRGRDGAPFSQAAIDDRATRSARKALGGGAALLIHALDISRGGLSGVSRGAARSIRGSAGDGALVLFDASEFRSQPTDIAAALDDGMMAVVSGSRFMGGPAHCAALALPRRLGDALEAAKPLFDADVSPARFDIPAAMRPVFAGGFDALLNVGLGLRWSAALAEIDRYQAVPIAIRDEALAAFSRRARALASRQDFVELEPRPIDEDDPLRSSVLTLFPRDPLGDRAGFLGASAIRAALALPRAQIDGDAVCHVGGPMRAGPFAALTIAASAPMISELYARMTRGATFERASAPVWRDLDALFAKWRALVE